MRIWSELQEALKRLNHEEIIGLPTETVYGLAAPIKSEKAIKKVFEIKERPFFDPLIVHIGFLSQVKELALDWTETENFLAKTFWPGPLTIVTKKQVSVNSLITAGLDSVGIRMPSHPIARRILREFKTPLAAPSANKFGRTSPTTYEHVQAEFPDDSFFILQGGGSDVGIESTVIQISETASEIKTRILRPGTITQSAIASALESFSKKRLEFEEKASQASPGHLDSHYQPGIPLIIASRSISAEAAVEIEKKFSLPERSRYSELILNTDPLIAARDLYSQMRNLAQSGIAWMYVRKSSDRQGEIWNSIWNRLERASSLRLE